MDWKKFTIYKLQVEQQLYEKVIESKMYCTLHCRVAESTSKHQSIATWVAHIFLTLHKDFKYALSRKIAKISICLGLFLIFSHDSWKEKFSLEKFFTPCANTSLLAQAYYILIKLSELIAYLFSWRWSS